MLLYNVLNKARPRSEHGGSTTQAGDEACSLVDRMKNLEIADLEEFALEALSKAKKRFKDSRKEATRAFNQRKLRVSRGYIIV